MKVTNLSITYINPLKLLLLSFIIGSFFWVAVPHARAGGASLCTNEFCQDSEEMCLNTDQCCVGGGFECPACFWTGSECVNEALGCCEIPLGAPELCVDLGVTLEECLSDGGRFFIGGECATETSCTPPQIPTLNEWGTFILAGVLGLFAVIGIIVMRRGSVVKTGSSVS